MSGPDARTRASPTAIPPQRRMLGGLIDRGIADRRVLKAFARVPRELFVARGLASIAYHDVALPGEEGQTLSQPYLVARLAQALELSGTDRVLEVGTGSGYGAAILASLSDQVYSIERLSRLSRRALVRLRALGITNVSVRTGDGSLGWPERAPYQAICVTAAAPAIPEPLIDQLGEGGRLVIPVGQIDRVQRLIRVRRRGPILSTEDLGPVELLPLIGEHGWLSA